MVGAGGRGCDVRGSRGRGREALYALGRGDLWCAVSWDTGPVSEGLPGCQADREGTPDGGNLEGTQCLRLVL